MPAFSQNLLFHVNNGNTVTNTVQVVYPNSATTALVYYSDKIRGDGYFSNSDGFHTVAWSILDFVGTISVQGTLSTDPADSDWADVKLSLPGNTFSVDTTGLGRAIETTPPNYTTATTSVETYNIVGNFVWLRGKISDFTEGTVHVISINR